MSKHADLLKRLLPPSSYDQNGQQISVELIADGSALDIAQVSADYLLDETDPRTAFWLLSDWERVAGLPDTHLGTPDTLQGRRAQLVTKLTSMGGQSIAYFEDYAAKLGFPIAISEFSQWRMGITRMGSRLCGADWAFAWAVDAGPAKVTSFRMGLSAMGEPLRSWGNAVLEAALRKVAPAHTLIIFRYPLANADLGPFVLDSSRIG